MTAASMEAVSQMAPGKWYKQVFRNGDTIYFTPLEQQKNRGFKGLQVDLYVDTGRPKKAKSTSVVPSNFSLWTEIPEREVPKNVMSKFKARMEETEQQEDLWPSIWARSDVELGEDFKRLAGLDYEPLHEAKTGEIILKQMGGGNRIMAMLGARKFLLLPKGVAIGWPSRQRSKGNYVEIELRPDDTYTMTFYNVSPKYGKKKVKQYDMIYADQLVPVFEKQTGYYLRL